MAQNVDIKKRPDLFAVMAKAGMELSTSVDGKPTVSTRCPFHDDQGRPNFIVWVETATWHCFRCGIGGDVYDFVGRQEYGNEWNPRDREMFKTIVRKIEQDAIPLVENAPRPIKEKTVAAAVTNVLGFASRVYHLTLLSSPQARQAREYLVEERGIDLEAIRALRIGYVVPGSLAGALAAYPIKLREAAEIAGLFHEGREWLSRRITFPDIAAGGKVLDIVGRDTEPKAALRYLSLPGIPKTVYRLKSCSKNKPILLTESMVDTVNLWQMGFQGSGTNGTGLAWYLVKELNGYPFIGILKQNDNKSQEAAERWKISIPHAREMKIPYRDGADFEKDVNNIFTKRGKRECQQIISEALAQVGFH